MPKNLQIVISQEILVQSTPPEAKSGQNSRKFGTTTAIFRPINFFVHFDFGIFVINLIGRCR